VRFQIATTWFRSQTGVRTFFVGISVAEMNQSDEKSNTAYRNEEEGETDFVDKTVRAGTAHSYDYESLDIMRATAQNESSYQKIL
jgi:hypothetical protein